MSRVMIESRAESLAIALRQPRKRGFGLVRDAGAIGQ